MNVCTKKSGQIQHHVLKSNKILLPGYKINLNKPNCKIGFFFSCGLLYLKLPYLPYYGGIYSPLKCSKEEILNIKRKKLLL